MKLLILISIPLKNFKNLLLQYKESGTSGNAMT